jgi:hypothetical protein
LVSISFHKKYIVKDQKRKRGVSGVIIIEPTSISGRELTAITEAAATVSLNSFFANFHMRKLKITVVIIEENHTKSSES